MSWNEEFTYLREDCEGIITGGVWSEQSLSDPILPADWVNRRRGAFLQAHEN